MEELKISELKALLREQGLKVSGKKSELIARLEGKEEEKPILKTVKEQKEEEKPVQKPALKTMEEQKKIEERKIIKTFLPFPEILYNPLTIPQLLFFLKKRKQSCVFRKREGLIKRLVEKDKADLLKKMNFCVHFIEDWFSRRKTLFNQQLTLKYASIPQASLAQKKICRAWKNHKNQTLNLISFLKGHLENLRTFHLIVQKILIENPPAKNENKFIYGKLVEYAVFHLMKKCGLTCVDLDEKQNVGSEFKNDCLIENQKYSIKTLKNYNDIILINKNSNDRKYSVKTNYLLCVIEQSKLYFFPSFVFDVKSFVVDNEANITMKKNIFNYLEDKHPEYIIQLPELNRKQKETLSLCREKNRIKEMFDTEYAF